MLTASLEGQGLAKRPSYYKDFARNNIAIIASYILSYSKGIILVPLLVKNIGVAQYGAYVLLSLGLGFISMVSPLGVGFSLKRYMPSAKEITAKRNLFYPQFIFQLTIATVISIAALFFHKPIKEYFLKGGIEFSVPLLAVIIMAYMLFYASTDYFRYGLKTKEYAFAIAAEPILMLLFVALAIFVFSQKTINAVLVAFFLSLTAISLPLLAKIYREIGFLPFHFTLRGIFKDARLGLPLVLSYLLDFVLSVSDRYIIAAIISTAAVGCYNPAYSLGSLIGILPKICGGVVLPPLLAKAADDQRAAEVRILMEYTVKLFLVAAIPFFMASLILGKQALILLTDIEIAREAYLIIPIVAFATILYGVGLIYSQALFIQLKTKTILKVNVACAFLNISLNLVFIPIFKSIFIAAFTTLLTYFVYFILFMRIASSYAKIRYETAFILKCVLASILMGILLYFLQSPKAGIMRFSGLFIAAVVSYGLFLAVFRVFKEEEVQFLKRIFSKG